MIAGSRRVVLLGDSGSGKSHLLIGLGLAACEQGRRGRYVTCAQLVNELVEAADERILSRIVVRYGRLDLLCLDELGYVKIDHRGAELLFQIITEREERASIATTTNLPFSEWGSVFPDPASSPPSSTGSPSTPTSSKPAPSPTDSAPARPAAAAPLGWLIGHHDDVPNAAREASDGITERLRDFEARLRTELGAAATIERTQSAQPRITIVSIEPHNPLSMPVHWMEMDHELQIGVGHDGNRWELDRTSDDVDFIEDVVQTVIDGRISQTRAPLRSAVDLTLTSGRTESHVSYQGPLSFFPLPGWQRWGQRTQFEPYI